MSNQFKPAILQCFGDIAQAIGGAFETYLSVIGSVLQQAGSVNINTETSYEMLDYIISLREAIMDAWAGAISSMKAAGKPAMLQPYVETIFHLLHVIHSDPNRTEALLRSSMGVVGDLSTAFPNGECADYFRQDWISAMAKEIRANREFSDRTRETARWARLEIKKQIGGNENAMS